MAAEVTELTYRYKLARTEYNLYCLVALEEANNANKDEEFLQARRDRADLYYRLYVAECEYQGVEPVAQDEL